MSIQEVEDLQRAIDRWYSKTTADMQTMHAKFTSQIRFIEELVVSGGLASAQMLQQQQQSNSHNTSTGSVGAAAASKPRPQGLEWDQLLTPSRNVSGGGRNEERTPSMASPPVSHAINYDALIDEAIGKKQQQQQQQHADGDPSRRRTPESLSVGGVEAPAGHIAPDNRNLPCQVLVEFKRKRILQFESPYYVAPGEYVVVGGDRGEDIGLVTHSWPAGSARDVAKTYAGVGLGKVQRIANVLEVSQLQGVQTELEARAVDVAQEKVVEHQLPMRIVDAEYQFDRKKLTFYYQSQHRLDFRTLVRDLYKTFRARIWMEQDGA
jgi:hypothetical protein